MSNFICTWIHGKQIAITSSRNWRFRCSGTSKVELRRAPIGFEHLLSMTGLVTGRSMTPPPLPPVAAVHRLLGSDAPHPESPSQQGDCRAVHPRKNSFRPSKVHTCSPKSFRDERPWPGARLQGPHLKSRCSLRLSEEKSGICIYLPRTRGG